MVLRGGRRFPGTSLSARLISAHHRHRRLLSLL